MVRRGCVLRRPDEHRARLRWPKRGELWTVSDGYRYERARIMRIVLTIAHLDHVPENCGRIGDRANLRAWCQRCHLRYDAKHHAQTARALLRARIAVAELF